MASSSSRPATANLPDDGTVEAGGSSSGGGGGAPFSTKTPRIHRSELMATTAGINPLSGGASAAPRMPVSPPTPAPSPRPRPRTQPSDPLDSSQSIVTDEDQLLDGSNLATSSSDDTGTIMSPRGASSMSPWTMDPQALTRAATLLLPTLPSSSRLTLLSDLLMLLTPAELAQIAALVSSKLRVDFLSALPIEISLHILSYIDDPLTLGRASQVCRFWRSLVNDEHTWEAMCSKYRYRYRRPSTEYPRPSGGDTGPTASGTDLLASLYRRYRQRGLDPSNARDELRALHDLFLAKQQQQQQAPGTSGQSARLQSSVPAMSDADLHFYEQLEQIVQEESRDRYGNDTGGQPNNVSLARHQQEDTGASRLGWLSAGPAATRFPRTPQTASQSRLPALNTGWVQPIFEASNNNNNNRATAPNASNGPFSSWTGGLGLPWGLSELISLPSSLTGAVASTAAAARLPLALPPYTTGGSSRLATTAGRRTTSDHWSRRPGPSPSPGDTIGLGRPSGSTSRLERRAATYAAGPLGAEAFSYKAHFKRNYLTESNWHRGGRLLTNHISNGGDPTCTSLAMDERYLIIGMANGNIHIFDARTGLFERSIRGRPENGVWCMVLVSKTKGAKKSEEEKVDAMQGKGKERENRQEAAPYTPKNDSEGHTSYLTTHDDLTLVKHDVRLTKRLKELQMTQSTRNKGRRRKFGSSKVSKTEPDDIDGDDQTLHWFHQARMALQQGSISASSSEGHGNIPQTAPRSTVNSNDPDLIGGFPRDLVEAGPAFVRESMIAEYKRQGADMSVESRRRWERTVVDMEESLTRIREENGITGQRRIPRPGIRKQGKQRDDEDVDMEDRSSSTSGKAQERSSDDNRNGMDEDYLSSGSDEEGVETDESDDFEWAFSSEEEYQGFSMGIGGTASGLGTLCGATRGYGNSSALLVSGGCDRHVKVWDVATGELKFSMHGHASTVRCLRVLDGRPIAISGGRDSTVRVWDISTGKSLRVLAGHQNSVRCLEVAGNQVATGSYDCTCRIWNVDTGECLHVLRGHYNQIYCIGFDGKKVATGSLDSTVRIWSAESGEPLALLQGHTALVGVLQLSNNILISGGSDGRIIAYSLTDLSLLYAICAHDNSVSSLQFDEHFILTGGNDGTVRLWNLADGSFIRELVRPGDSIWKLAFRDDRVVIVCKESDGSLSMEVLDFRPVEGALAGGGRDDRGVGAGVGVGACAGGGGVLVGRE